MPRIELARLGDVRKAFVGTFVREGWKRGWQGVDEPTVLLKDIRVADTGEKVASHLWFNKTQGFTDAIPENLETFVPGTKLKFVARVDEYEKGYKGHKEDVAIEKPVTTDWKLSRPTKIEVVEEPTVGSENK